MKPRFSANITLISMGIDASAVCLSLFLAKILRPYMNPLPGIQNIKLSTPFPITLYILFPVLWISIYFLLSNYGRWLDPRKLDDLFHIVTSGFLAVIASAGLLYLSYRNVSRALFITFVIFSFINFIVWRLIARLIFIKQINTQKRKGKVVIIGTGEIGLEAKKNIEQLYYEEFDFIGFLDDEQNQNHLPYKLGAICDAKLIIEKHTITDVVITLPSKEYDQINSLVSALHNTPVDIWIIPDFFQMALHQAKFANLANLPMLDIRAPALTDDQRLLKRAFDLLLIVCFFPFIFVLIILIAISIKIGSPGPILFHQVRVGENGKLFKMIKFRTMMPGADELIPFIEQVDEKGHYQYKFRNDPRVTPIGKILRKTSLDEIPQVFNVLKGEMSLVGPRPELPHLVNKYEAWQRKRFTVPPGITGWWQVNGRSDRPNHLHTEDDLYYIHHYSIALDLRILLKTIAVVLSNKGAF